jgi:hypothetical protein
MSMFSPGRDPARDPAPVALQNVRPVPARPVARPAARPPATVDPALTRIARDHPRYTTARIDGRPVIVYIERDRLRWGKLAALVAAIVVPILGVLAVAVYAVASVVAWLIAHWLLILGTATVVLVALVLVPALTSRPTSGHCPGPWHR